MDNETKVNLKFALGSAMIDELKARGGNPNMTYGNSVQSDDLEDESRRRSASVVYTAQFAETEVNTTTAEAAAAALTSVAVSYVDSGGNTKTATITASAATAVTASPTPAPQGDSDDDDVSDAVIAVCVVAAFVVMAAAAVVVVKVQRAKRAAPMRKTDPIPDSTFQSETRRLSKSSLV